MLHRELLPRVMMSLACTSNKAGELLLLTGNRLDGIVPNTPVPQRSTNGAMKRKAAFDTPAVPKFKKADGMNSPSDARTNGNTTSAQ